MKFSIEDVANQRFEMRFRGYDPEQVHEFLAVVARELDAVVTDGRRLERELAAAQRELGEYRKRERSLQDALEMARETAEELRQKAAREAELRIAEAELEAERVVTRAQRAADALDEEGKRLKEQRRRVVAELRATLEMHLHLLDSQRQPDWVESADP